MNILIVDDQRIIVQRIERLIREKYECHTIFTALCSSDVSKLVEEGTEFDLAFLDISLDNENGTDIANFLSCKQKGLRIVFISGYPEMISDVFFSVKPFGFIDKPIKTEKLYKYIDAAEKEISESHEAFICRIRGRDINIEYSRIIYIHSECKNLLIHMVEGDIIKAAGLIEETEKLLPDSFIRCHKSYIINLRYASGYIRQEVSMMGGDSVPVSRSRKEEFEKAYSRYKGYIK